MAADWLGTPAALLAAAWLANWRNAALAPIDGRPTSWAWYPGLLPPTVLLLAAVLWPIVLILLGAYGGRRAAGLAAELRRVGLAVALAGTVLAVALALTSLDVPLSVLIIFLTLDAAVLSAVRLALAASSGNHGAKRIFDVVASLGALAVMWPVMAVVALAIRLESPGPVLFRQKRIGQHGRPFTLLKFRSMVVGAGDELHLAHVTRLIQDNRGLQPWAEGSLKLARDPRLTRVGAFIRKTSLDELPQFLNVLAGEMSVVGPRPPIPYEVDLYQDWHKRRLAALPGITGLWQVRGRNRVSFDEMVRMDLEYIEHQSVWLDLRLALETPWAALTGRGAG